MDDFLTRNEHELFEKLMKSENENLHDEDNRINHRLAILETTVSQIHVLTVSVEKMAVSMEQMLREQQDIGTRLTNIEAEPGKDYKHIKTVAVSAIVTAIFTTLVGAAFLLFNGVI